MATSYPGGFDSYAAHAAFMDSAPTHDSLHVNTEDAIESIETTLGLNPQGSDASVLARLVRLDLMGTKGVSTFGVSDQTGFTSTPSDVASSSVTFTAVAGRRYEITAFLPLLQLTSTGVVVVALNRGGTDIKTIFRRDSMAANERDIRASSQWDVPGAGSVTYKLRAQTSAGTLTINNSIQEGHILIKDIGT